jgi:hypothetical protein
MLPRTCSAARGVFCNLSIPSILSVSLVLLLLVLFGGCSEDETAPTLDHGVRSGEKVPDKGSQTEGFLWPDLGVLYDGFVWPDGVPDLMPDDAGGSDADGASAADGPPKDGGPTCIDAYEPNSTCSTGYSLGSTNEGSSWLTTTATLYPISDPDWYSAKGLEGSHVCFPFTSQCYTFTVRVEVPTGRKFKVCLYQDACSATATCASNSTLPGPVQLEAQYNVSGTCTLNDDTTAYILVEPLDLLTDCTPYKILVNYDQC